MSRTIFEAYNDTKKQLLDAKIEDFTFEAKQIIKHITGFDNTQILARYNDKLTEFQENNLTAIIKQRKVRYPLQYIIGEWGFYGRSFDVGPGVLIPRADTETLIDVCKGFLKGKEKPQVLDLCTGSGCIGITLALECPESKVILVEKYDTASIYAWKNIAKLEVKNAVLMAGDVFEGTANEDKYDLIVSNPPYIPINEMKTVSPEVEYEPETALVAGDDGMMFYNAIVDNYKQSLNAGGMLAFEVGIGEADTVSKIMTDAGLENVKVQKDMNGIDRVVFGTVTLV